MKNQDKKIREDILNEIAKSNMTIQRKMRLMELMDSAFRKYLGIIYLSDKELEKNDILNRSM